MFKDKITFNKLRELKRLLARTVTKYKIISYFDDYHCFTPKH